MTDAPTAPERIWTCSHVGEYGNYFPDPVEAEGKYGGWAIDYVRGDVYRRVASERDALAAENERLREALTEIERLYYREAKDASWRAVQMRAIARAALEEGKDG